MNIQIHEEILKNVVIGTEVRISLPKLEMIDKGISNLESNIPIKASSGIKMADYKKCMKVKVGKRIYLVPYYMIHTNETDNYHTVLNRMTGDEEPGVDRRKYNVYEMGVDNVLGTDEFGKYIVSVKNKYHFL